MSVLIKFLLILILVIYAFYKVAGFLFKIVFGNLRNDPGQFSGRNQHYSKRAPGSNLNIDKIPTNRSSKGQSYNGGEYVDYEEVK